MVQDAGVGRAVGAAVDETVDGTVAADLGRMPVAGEDVLTRLAEVVAVRRDALAVSWPGGRLGYAELGEEVLALAAVLRAHGVGDAPAAGAGPAPVAVLADQGAATVVATFAVMAAGAPVVLLDPLLPAERTRDLAELAGVELVLVGDDPTGAAPSAAGAGGAPAPWRTLALTVPSAPGARPAAEVAADLAAARGTGDDLAPATIIFTSGSTGRPKGVLLAHRNVLAAAHFGRERLGITAADRVALVLPHAFSAGQEVAFAALLGGASLHVLDPRTAGLRGVPGWLASEGVTTLHGTPSLLRALTGALVTGQVLAGLRLVTACGEVVRGRDVTGLRPHLGPGAVFTAWFGSSEGGMLAFNELGPDAEVPSGALPVGTPPPGKELLVVDDAGAPLPAGRTGAVVVVSDLLPQGYWRDPARTAARFEPLPDGRVRHATGDRGRLDADGVLHLAGRADDAVKVRGYLVEPAEVEAVLLAVRGVGQAVVRGRELPVAGGGAAVQLVAWVVPDPQVGLRSAAALRRAARAALPEWMVPSALVLVAALPLTERGKLDAARLPDPPPRPEPAPLVDEDAQRLGALWAGVLELSAVGADESFSDLGGDSLAVEEMLARVREQTGVALALKDLAEHPTLAEFTDLVAERTRARTWRPRRSRSGAGGPTLAPTTLRFRASGGGLPVFCFAGNAGHAAAFAPLAAGLGPEHPVHGFQVNGLTNRGLLDWTVRSNAARHVRDVQAISPTGPVVLLGHSLGGVFALEAARQLAARGRQVPLVVLVDTFLPPRHGGHVGDWDSMPAAPGAQRPDRSAVAGTSPWQLVLRTLRRQDSTVLRRRLMLLGAGPLKYRPEVNDHVMWQHGLWLGRTARITPWAGRTLLFTSEENRDVIDGWESVLVGPHEVVAVSGDHAGLLKPPFLPAVLARVRAALDEVSPAS